MKSLALSVFLLATTLPVLAQDMQPPKQVTDLGWMVGTWSGSGKFTFSGQEMDFSSTMVMSFEGQFVKSVTMTEMGGMRMDETMMMGWNEPKKEFVSYTFTGFAPMPGIKRGKMDGGNLVMVSEPWEVEGQSVVSRSTYAKLSDTKFHLTMELKNGDNWEKAMDIEMTKK